MDNQMITTEINTSTTNLMFDQGMFGQMQKLAQVMASGKSTIPAHLQGNQGDCMAIIMQAAQWRMNPYAVAQKTHLVKGVLGYEAQLVNAVVTTMAPIEGRLTFEAFGDWDKVVGKFTIRKSDKGDYAVPAWTPEDEKGLGVLVSGTFKGETEPRTLRLLMSQCWPRQSTNWSYDPQQQTIYAGIKKWARRFCPDVLLGVYTPDELQPEIDITPQTTVMDLMPKAKPAPVTNIEHQPSIPVPQAATHPDPQPEPVAQTPAQAQPAKAEQNDVQRISRGMLNSLRAAMDRAGIDDSEICEAFKVDSLESLAFSDLNQALALCKQARPS